MQATVLAKTNGMSRLEWLEARQRGIGGSDVAAIFRVHPYKSNLQLYLEKVGGWHVDEEISEAAEIGLEAEELVARLFMKRFERDTGQPIKVQKVNAILQHRDYKFMLANLDRRIIGENAGLECKTSSEWRRGEWDNGCPPEYLLQCMHYMAVTGFDYMYLAVLIGGNKLRWQKIERDEELIADLIVGEREFWDEHVEKQIPPDPGGSNADTDCIKALYPLSDGKEIELPNDALFWLEQIKAYEPIRDNAEEKIEEAKNRLKVMMQDAETAKIGRFFVSWKSNKTFDEEAFKAARHDTWEYCFTPEIKFDPKKAKELIGPKEFEQYKRPGKTRPFKIKEFEEGANA